MKTQGSVYGVDAYPLYWPESWARHKGRKSQGRYQVTFAAARDATIAEIAKLGGRMVVISSNIPLRRDGLPAAYTTEPSDTGVAVYWTEGPSDNPQHRVLACDCWSTVRSNLRAINLSIAALNAIKRAGATQILDRAYTGFAALPTGDKKAWFDVLGVSPHASLEVIDAAFRALAFKAHPDRGGSVDRMAEISAAYVEAKRARQ